MSKRDGPFFAAFFEELPTAGGLIFEFIDDGEGEEQPLVCHDCDEMIITNDLS